MSNFAYPLKEKIGSDYNSPMNMDHVKSYYRSTLTWGEELQLQITFEFVGDNSLQYWSFENSEDREEQMTALKFKLKK